MAAMAAGQIDLEASFPNMAATSSACIQYRSPCHPAPTVESITVEQQGTKVTLDVYEDSHVLKIHSHVPGSVEKEEKVADGRDEDERIINYTKPYRVTIDAFKKRTVEMTVLPNELIKTFRTRLLKLLALPRQIEAAMTMIHNGVAMDDPFKMVKAYGIQKGSWIQCVWRFYRVLPKRNPGILPCRDLEEHLIRHKRLPSRLSRSLNSSLQAAMAANRLAIEMDEHTRCSC